jgi:DNA relaxase NicK
MAALLYFSKDLLEQEEGSGGVRKPWYFQGYAGHQVGQVQSGFKATGVCVRASGAAARECAAQLLECADNCSRLDLQVTVRADECGDDYAEKLHRDMLGRVRRRGRPVERTLITSTYSGDTLYLGRRVSDQYGRIYNKSAEEKTKEEPPRWRFEVEYKRGYAKAAASAYVKANASASWCASTVHSWYANRGVSAPVSALASPAIRCDARGTAEEANRLRWLKVGVRPAVVELAAKYGWPDVLRLLGCPLATSERYVNEVLGLEE